MISFQRIMLVATLSASFLSLAHAEDRSIDGTGNSIATPSRGAANTPMVRHGYSSQFKDSAGAMLTDADRANARDISNAIFAQSESVLSARNLSDYMWAWGQFVSHDTDLSTTSNGAATNGYVPDRRQQPRRSARTESNSLRAGKLRQRSDAARWRDASAGQRSHDLHRRVDGLRLGCDARAPPSARTAAPVRSCSPARTICCRTTRRDCRSRTMARSPTRSCSSPATSVPTKMRCSPRCTLFSRGSTIDWSTSSPLSSRRSPKSSSISSPARSWAPKSRRSPTESFCPPCWAPAPPCREAEQYSYTGITRRDHDGLRSSRFPLRPQHGLVAVATRRQQRHQHRQPRRPQRLLQSDDHRQ